MSDIKKINSAIDAIRQERLKFVETTLMTRQQEIEKIAKIGGTAPVKPELTISDYQHIENVFNKQIAALKEKLRLAEAEHAATSIDPLEDQLEAAKKAQDEAAQVLSEREAQVKGIEGQIARTLRMIEAVGERRNVIKFQPRTPDLMDKRTSRQVLENSKKSILNY